MLMFAALMILCADGGGGVSDLLSSGVVVARSHTESEGSGDESS